jgi:hypothetical protein
MDPTDLRAGLADKLGTNEPIDALDLTVAEAAPLIRRLLRVAGRVVIDTGTAGASADTWPNTEEMALLWIDEGLRELGYEVRPSEDGGRLELKRQDAEWGG